VIKCVIWDLDNTIFDGVISEQESVDLRPRVKSTIEALADRGVISSVASRNDSALGLKALSDVGLRDLMVYPQISWGQKSESVSRILADLHLRPEDVAFVDDQQFEREEVGFRFPRLRLFDASDIDALSREAADGSGDRTRLSMYKDEERRLAAFNDFDGSKTSFLHSCAIEVMFRPATVDDVPRVSELLSRTNQLNSNKVQLGDDRLAAAATGAGQEGLFVVSVKDRYGDYGLSGAVLCSFQDLETADVEVIVVSCRLMGKGIAQALLAHVADQARQRGRDALNCKFVSTNFNRQMHLLFAMNGFTRIELDGQLSYKLPLDTKNVSVPEWLAVVGETGEQLPLDSGRKNRSPPSDNVENCTF